MVAVEALARTPFFLEMEGRTRERLSHIATRRKYRAGHVIYHEGDSADTIGVLVNGMISFRGRVGDEDGVTLGHAREPGAVFGWSGVSRSAGTYGNSAVCIEDCDIIELDAEALLKLCHDEPEVGVAILEKLSGVISERLESVRAQNRLRLRPGIISHG